MSGTDRLVVETPGLPREEGTALLERMLLIRRFEDAVQRLFQRGEVHGTTHLYSRQARLVCARRCDPMTGWPERIADTGTRWRSAWIRRG